MLYGYMVSINLSPAILYEDAFVGSYHELYCKCLDLWCTAQRSAVHQTIFSHFVSQVWACFSLEGSDNTITLCLGTGLC